MTTVPPHVRAKNPHAAVLGRLGGLKGGPASAAALSPEERSQKARKAVAARWAKARAITAIVKEVAGTSREPQEATRRRKGVVDDYFVRNPIRVASLSHDLGVELWEAEQRIMAAKGEPEPAKDEPEPAKDEPESVKDEPEAVKDEPEAVKDEPETVKGESEKAKEEHG